MSRQLRAWVAVVGLMVNSGPIQRLKKLVELHEQHSDLLKQIIDHLPMSLTVQDGNGCFILANTMATANLGIAAEDLIGSVLRGLFVSGVKPRHHVVSFGEFGPTVGDINPGGLLFGRYRSVSLLARQGRAYGGRAQAR